MGARKIKKTPANVASMYSAFDQIDGHHPWMDKVPDGYVPYRVRELGMGEIAYFNFPLAKEMGLIPADHPNQLTEALKKKLLATFSIQIINEYDEMTGRKFDPSTIKPNKYMASRYLQLQHSNKKGKTSGDGRGIWNGTVENRGKIWDVSSRGTGVTCLAPGAVAAGKPLETGASEFGYGCGKAEIDELYGAALLAEMMHLQGISTERVLCVIDLGKGFGIGVRAALNLIRPAHLFLYLKQNRKAELKAAIDYFIDRQVRNGRWKPKARGAAVYDELAEEMARSFGGFTAKLDTEYIFAWLDWDGDNVLADAGIIDYGSVRQFGLRHDRYRYDDVERFSTNLNEQRQKARLIVQVFCQIADVLRGRAKQALKAYGSHPTVQKFDRSFTEERAHRILYRVGFNQIQRENILKERGLFEQFDQVFSYFERAKVSGSVRKVPDGVNHPALFDMRAVCRALPAHLLKNGIDQAMSEDEFFKTLLSSFARTKDLRSRPKHTRLIQKFQEIYRLLLKAAAGRSNPKLILPGITARAGKLNTEERITGNALIQIVDEILTQRRRGASHETVQAWIEQLIFAYVDHPEVAAGNFYPRSPRAIPKPEVLDKLLELVHEHKHDI